MPLLFSCLFVANFSGCCSRFHLVFLNRLSFWLRFSLDFLPRSCPLSLLSFFSAHAFLSYGYAPCLVLVSGSPLGRFSFALSLSPSPWFTIRFRGSSFPVALPSCIPVLCLLPSLLAVHCLLASPSLSHLRFLFGCFSFALLASFLGRIPLLLVALVSLSSVGFHSRCLFSCLDASYRDHLPPFGFASLLRLLVPSALLPPSRVLRGSLRLLLPFPFLFICVALFCSSLGCPAVLPLVFRR